MREAIQEILDAIDQEEFYKEYIPELNFNSTGKAPNVCCPFHTDNTPSLSIDIDKGFKCHGCDASGTNIVGFFWKWHETVLGQKIKFQTAVRKLYSKHVHPLVKDTIVTKWNASLLQNVPIQKKLKARGIPVNLIKKYNLGYDLDDERITIPILNAHGWVTDVRKISLKSKIELGNVPKNLPYDYLTAKKKREMGEKTHGEGGRLFPYDNIYEKKIILCEGEFDCIILNHWGFSAVTAGSISNWGCHLELFKDKIVYICFDNDKPGQEAAHKLLTKLYPLSKRVSNILLPIEGDVTDFWKKGYRDKEFSLLLEKSSAEDINIPERTETNEEIHHLSSLTDISNPKNYGKYCDIVARIAGEEESHYTAPLSYLLRCGMDYTKRNCFQCPMSDCGGRFEGTIEKNDNALLSFIGLTDKKMGQVLASRNGIITTCPKLIFERELVTNIQEVLLSPSLERKENGTVIKDNILAFNLSGPLEINVDHKLEGYITHDPNTQRNCLVILKATRVDLHMDNFSIPKKNKVKELKAKFNPEELDPDAIIEKHGKLLDILVNNVTNIYEREDLHAFVDLTFHSPLETIFDGKLQNSYMEIAIIGDTNTGKDAVVKQLSKYYNAGAVLDSGACTIVGLIGGMVKKKYFCWGSYVQQHRKLIALNEGGHLSKTIDALRMIREGTAYYDKADAKRQTNSQVRFIVMANDPEGWISANPYPIAALTNLFGKEADISRFTTALFLRIEDNPLDIINAKRPPHIITDITQEDFQFKLANAWALTASNIVHPNGTVEKCYEVAKSMSKKYECSLPLVQSSVQWKKISIVGTAMAAALYSMDDDGKKLIVPWQYMVAAQKRLETSYDSPSCEYNLLAEQERAKLTISDPKMVMEIVFDKERSEGSTGNLFHCLQFLISRKELTSNCMQDAFLFCTDFVIAKEIIKILHLNNCIERNGPNFKKTKAFTRMLKKLLKEEKGRK